MDACPIRKGWEMSFAKILKTTNPKQYKRPNFNVERLCLNARL